MSSQRIFSVSELTSSIRQILETQFSFISVAGEISNLRKPHSGHIYFTLKDPRSQIKGVLFKMQQRYLNQKPKDGQQVICRGRLSVYEPRGDYQLIVDTIEFQGTGALQIAFEKLKAKLASEGLFDEAIKKPAPTIPNHITLVTSPDGAAVHDFIKVAQQRYPQTAISVFPVAVQGDNAGEEICQAIKKINNSKNTDIIVLCRGGGSIEDLWAFNEEKVARTIHWSKIMITSAVGHEIDYTIADFAADLRAPTPSAAAELLLPDQKSLRAQVNQAEKRLTLIMNSIIDSLSSHLALHRQILGDMYHPLENMLLKLDYSSSRIEQALTKKIEEKQNQLNKLTNNLEQHNPGIILDQKAQHLSQLKKRLLTIGSNMIENRQKTMESLVGVLDAVSPLATLARGYSITRQKNTGEIITHHKDAATGSRVEIILHNGKLLCLVEKTENHS